MTDRPEFGQRLPKAARKRTSSPAASRPPDEDRVDDYRHESATRLNVPEAGLATQDRSAADQRDVRDGDDRSLTCEPEQIRASCGTFAA